MFVDGNVYTTPITQHVCDTCIRDDELKEVTLRRYAQPIVHVMQRPPWRWWPDGMSGGYTCDRCGRIVCEDGTANPPYKAELLARLEDRPA